MIIILSQRFVSVEKLIIPKQSGESLDIKPRSVMTQIIKKDEDDEYFAQG